MLRFGGDRVVVVLKEKESRWFAWGGWWVHNDVVSSTHSHKYLVGPKHTDNVRVFLTEVGSKNILKLNYICKDVNQTKNLQKKKKI